MYLKNRHFPWNEQDRGGKGEAYRRKIECELGEQDFQYDSKQAYGPNTAPLDQQRRALKDQNCWDRWNYCPNTW